MTFWFVHICLILGISIAVYKKWGLAFNPFIYWIALLAKLSAGIVLGFIFKEYYGSGDTLMFFEQSKSLASLPLSEHVSVFLESSNYESSNQPRVAFFVKFLSFFTRITGGSYWISSLYLSLISFFASWYFVRIVRRNYSRMGVLSIACFLFIPTIIFWSSGIQKDSIAFAGLALSIGFILSIYNGEKPRILEWILIAISIFILLKVKHYLLITLILFIGLVLFIRLIKGTSVKSKLIAIGAITISLFATQLIHPYFKLDRMPLTLFENNQAITTKTDQEDRINLMIESPEWSSILREVPEALRTGLFRPTLFDPTPIWGWFHRIENTILLFLSVTSILLFFKNRPSIDVPIVASGIICICLLSVLLSLSTPNLGSLVRYKNAFMPYFFLLSSILPYQYFTSKKA